MTEKFFELTGKTAVPLSLIVVGWIGIDWVLDLKKDTEINAMVISQNKNRQEKIIDKIEKNNERLARIEEIVSYIKTTLEKSND